MMFFSSTCLAWLVLSLPLKTTGFNQAPLDYMTKEEVDHVREAQPIDLRVKVFMKIAERRLVLVENPQAPPSKDDDDWGALPRGSRTDMLRQYNRAIEEAITNFEEAYDRHPKDERILKALTTFTEQTAEHLQRLEALRPTTTDEAARQVLEQVLDDLKLAYEDARQSEEQFKLEQEQRKKEKKKS